MIFILLAPLWLPLTIAAGLVSLLLPSPGSGRAEDADAEPQALTTGQLRDLLAGPGDGAALPVRFTNEGGWHGLRDVVR